MTPARIVFDLDGTLIDSAKDIQSIANASIERLDVAPITMDETISFIGKGIGVFVEKMRAARDIPDAEHDQILAEITERYAGAVTLTELYPGVRSALETLEQTHRMGVCTNKLLDPCLAVLKHLKIDTHFNSIWGGDNPLGRKPDPASLLAVFDELGHGPRLYVGDSETDAETAKRADVPFLLFTRGYRVSAVEDIPHTASFDDFADLPGLVERTLTT